MRLRVGVDVSRVEDVSTALLVSQLNCLGICRSRREVRCGCSLLVWILLLSMGGVSRGAMMLHRA